MATALQLVKSIKKPLGAIMKTILALTVLVFSTQAMAFEKEDSFNDVRQALMNSNKDYNQQTKVILDQENARIQEWNAQEQKVIEIDADIQVEARHFELIDLQEEGFQEEQEAQDSFKVSMND